MIPATTLDLEDLSEGELRNRISRGDYIRKPELAAAAKVLKRLERERKFQEKCELASKTSALNATINARRANYIALAALILSLISAREQLSAMKNFAVHLFLN